MSNTSRTVPRAVVGASAGDTTLRLSQRGTDPYSAKHIASMTVDLPDPVGPTSAKKSASRKSMRVGSRNTVNPCRSSRTGSI